MAEGPAPPPPPLEDAPAARSEPPAPPGQQPASGEGDGTGLTRGRPCLPRLQVRRKVEGKRPPSLLELEWLLMVMVTNALVHAAPDTAEYEAAREFKAHIKQVFAQARGECKHLLVGERPLAAKRKKKAEDEGGAGPSGRGRKAKKETERSSPGDGRAGGGGGKAEKAAPSKARGGAKKPAAKGGDGPKKERKKPAGGKGKKATSASPNENDGPQAKKKGGRAAKAEAKVEPLHMNGANGNGVEHGDGYGMTCIALKKRWLQQSMASFKRNGEDFAS